VRRLLPFVSSTESEADERFKLMWSVRRRSANPMKRANPTHCRATTSLHDQQAKRLSAPSFHGDQKSPSRGNARAR